MSIHVRCTHCDHPYTLADTQSGKRVRCRHCQGTFTATGDSEEIPDALDPRALTDSPGTVRVPVSHRNGQGAATAPATMPGRSRPARGQGKTPHKSDGGWRFPVLLLSGALLVVGVPVVVCAGVCCLYFVGSSAGPAAGPVAVAADQTVQVEERQPDVNLPPVEQPVGPPPLVKQPGPPAVPEPAPPQGNPPLQAGRQPKPPAPKPEPLAEKVTWDLKPDPQPQPIKGPFKTDATISVKFMAPVYYPTAPSPFVAVTVSGGLKGGDLARVYDLRAMQQVGADIPGKFSVFGTHQHPALSPEGKWFAGVVRGAARPTVEVFDVATGKSQCRVELGDRMFAGYVDFVGPDRLLTMEQGHQHPDPQDKGLYQVWDIKTGKEVCRFTHDLLFHVKWAAFSPGRQYLVMEETTNAGYVIYCWDLTTGKRVGQFEFQDKKDTWGQACGIAFTPDGEEFALLWRIAKPDCWCKLFCWDFRTGKKLHEYKIPYVIKDADVKWYDGGLKSLQWVPDKSGWLLFGHLLVDRESGAVVWQVPPTPKAGQVELPERRLLDRDHLVSLEGTAFEKHLTILTLPRADIDAAVKKAREK